MACPVNSTGLLIFADWYHVESIQKLRFFDDNTRSWWEAATGGQGPSAPRWRAMHAGMAWLRLAAGKQQAGGAWAAPRREQLVKCRCRRALLTSQAAPTCLRSTTCSCPLGQPLSREPWSRKCRLRGCRARGLSTWPRGCPSKRCRRGPGCTARRPSRKKVCAATAPGIHTFLLKLDWDGAACTAAPNERAAGQALLCSTILPYAGTLLGESKP